MTNAPRSRLRRWFSRQSRSRSTSTATRSRGRALHGWRLLLFFDRFTQAVQLERFSASIEGFVNIACPSPVIIAGSAHVLCAGSSGLSSVAVGRRSRPFLTIESHALAREAAELPCERAYIIGRRLDHGAGFLLSGNRRAGRR